MSEDKPRPVPKPPGQWKTNGQARPRSGSLPSGQRGAQGTGGGRGKEGAKKGGSVQTAGDSGEKSAEEYPMHAEAHRHHPGTRHRAVAPYGAVPLPEEPMAAGLLHEGLNASGEDLLLSHDRRISGTLTGWIDLDITTLTPLFIGANQDSDDPGTIHESLRLGKRPAIPGASLRGMTRHYLRMLTGGETGPVNTPQLYFRAPVKLKGQDWDRQVISRRRDDYENHRHGMVPVKENRPVDAGFLSKTPDGWQITPLSKDRPLRIRLDELKKDLDRWPEKFPKGFKKPPTPGRGGQDKQDNYIPAENNKEFQYLKVTALCIQPPLDPKRPDPNIKEYEYWALAVLPPGQEKDAAEEKRVRERLRDHWKNRRKARNPQRAEAFGKALDHVDTVSVYAVPAILVFTGITGTERQNAYLFPTRTPSPKGKPPLSVPKEMVEDFNTTYQITQFQEKNFTNEVAVGHGDPKRPQSRDGKYGTLAVDAPEPVWFQKDEKTGQVASFGRAGGYRVPVRGWKGDPIREAVPEMLTAPRSRARSDEDKGEVEQRLSDWREKRRVDIPRMLFGDLDLVAGKVSAARGRISFGAALCNVPEDGRYKHDFPLRVQLLKPGRTCFLNYLEQPPGSWEASQPTITTWSGEGDVRLGGYKIFLHRHEEGRLHAEFARPDHGTPGETERDVWPLRSGLTFRSRITFTNLAPAELGALLRALLLDNPVGGEAENPGHAHRIGMGKALGLGSIHLRPRLHLVDSAARADSLNLDAGVQHNAAQEKYLRAFDEALLGWELGQAEGDKPSGLHATERAGAVLLASQWAERLDWDCTRTMSVNQYSQYPVLPPITERFRYCRREERFALARTK